MPVLRATRLPQHEVIALHPAHGARSVAERQLGCGNVWRGSGRRRGLVGLLENLLLHVVSPANVRDAADGPERSKQSGMVLDTRPLERTRVRRTFMLIA